MRGANFCTLCHFRNFCHLRTLQPLCALPALPPLPALGGKFVHLEPNHLYEAGPSNLLFTAAADDLRLHLVDRRDVGSRRQRVLLLFLKEPDVLLERAEEDLLRDPGAKGFDKP